MMHFFEMQNVAQKIENRIAKLQSMTQRPTSLEFFEAVYLNENLPLSYRLRAATEHAKYTHAQLRAVAISQMDEHSFAAALAPPPAALAAPEQHPASELKDNFPMRRRNLR